MTALSPIPAVEAVVAPFFAAAAAGRLDLPRCESCDGWHWYPKPVCPRCGESWSWTSVEPVVRIQSWITVHRDLTASGGRDVPFTLVLVEVEGAAGVRLLVPTPAGSSPCGLAAGAPARLGFAAVPATGRTWPILERDDDR